MTDRELLELAAKAAGAAGADVIPGEAGYYAPQVLVRKRDGIEEYREWNPLTDDGDALRLAVKLGIDLHTRAMDQGSDPATAALYHADEPGWAAAVEPHENDPQAATRRAIVRAAAEIGRAM